MVSVTIEVRQGSVARRVRITAPSIEQAMKVAGGEEPSREVPLLLPLDPEAFFVTDQPGRRQAA